MHCLTSHLARKLKITHYQNQRYRLNVNIPLFLLNILITTSLLHEQNYENITQRATGPEGCPYSRYPAAPVQSPMDQMHGATYKDKRERALVTIRPAGCLYSLRLKQRVPSEVVRSSAQSCGAAASPRHRFDVARVAPLAVCTFSRRNSFLSPFSPFGAPPICPRADHVLTALQPVPTPYGNLHALLDAIPSSLSLGTLSAFSLADTFMHSLHTIVVGLPEYRAFRLFCLESGIVALPAPKWSRTFPGHPA